MNPSHHSRIRTETLDYIVHRTYLEAMMQLYEAGLLTSDQELVNYSRYDTLWTLSGFFEDLLVGSHIVSATCQTPTP
jgi:hypothetical protein